MSCYLNGKKAVEMVKLDVRDRVKEEFDNIRSQLLSEFRDEIDKMIVSTPTNIVAADSDIDTLISAKMRSVYNGIDEPVIINRLFLKDIEIVKQALNILDIERFCYIDSSTYGASRVATLIDEGFAILGTMKVRHDDLAIIFKSPIAIEED